MWEWMRGYVTAWGQIAALSDWSEALVQFAVTLMAGGLSFVIARMAISHQERINAEKASAIDLRLAGDGVMTAVFKLFDCGEILGGMRDLVTNQFRDAELRGFCPEPFAIIRATQGRDYSPERVLLSEISFLVKNREAELISDISLVYRRTLNCVHLSETHSADRVVFDEWTQNLPGHSGDLQGDLAGDTFSSDHLDGFNRRSANLNSTLASWIEQLDDTIVLVEDVTKRLGLACKKEFGKEFTTLSAEFPAKPITFGEIAQTFGAFKRRPPLEMRDAPPLALPMKFAGPQPVLSPAATARAPQAPSWFDDPRAPQIYPFRGILKGPFNYVLTLPVLARKTTSR